MFLLHLSSCVLILLKYGILIYHWLSYLGKKSIHVHVEYFYWKGLYDKKNTYYFILPSLLYLTEIGLPCILYLSTAGYTRQSDVRGKLC